MSLYDYITGRYAKAKGYLGFCVRRLIMIAEKYPQIKNMGARGLYDLRYGMTNNLGLPADFDMVEPHMRSYICERLTDEYVRVARREGWDAFLGNHIPVSGELLYPELSR